MVKLLFFFIGTVICLGIVLHIASQHINITLLPAKFTAVKKAKELFNKKQKEGMDFSNGPCLSNDLMPDWVADIVHDPRNAIDDLPENQCSAFRVGKAHHFVELSQKGNLIRTY